MHTVALTHLMVVLLSPVAPPGTPAAGSVPPPLPTTVETVDQSAAGDETAFAPPPDAALVADRLYVGIERPVLLRVEGLPEDLAWSLSIQEVDGREIFRVDDLIVREFDLAALCPSIWTVGQSVFAQIVVEDVPRGSSLVIQPLRTRSAVRTGEALRPDGRTPYTRIIGWGSDLLEPDNPDYVKLKESWKPGEPMVMSGLRLYPERDVALETSHGGLRIALRPDEAPNTAWNFRHLVESGFYEATVFHRIVPFDRQGQPFVIQGGDPTATGDGGPGWDLPIERSRLPHDFGVVSMARGDMPDTAGSQFFIALSRAGTARLDTQYCAFGEVVEGAEAIASMAELETADQTTGRPVEPPSLLSARLVAAPPREPGVGRPDRRVQPIRAGPKEPEATESGHMPR